LTVAAALHGKSILSEDALTSTVLGLLSYLPPHRGILGWLRKARPWHANVAPLRFPVDSKVSVAYWPNTSSWGIPDALIVAESQGGVHAILMEAKFESLKSQWEETKEPEAVPGDQLARYWEALADGSFLAPFLPLNSRCHARSLIYVTADHTPPKAELRESLERSRDPKMADNLYWLSWRNAWELAQIPGEASSPESRVIVDLGAYLDALELTPYRGFAIEGFMRPVGPARWTFSPKVDFRRASRRGEVHDGRWRFRIRRGR